MLRYLSEMLDICCYIATSNWNIPDDVLESLARCFLPAIIAFYETEEGQEYFAQWKAECEKKKAHKTDSEN